MRKNILDSSLIIATKDSLYNVKVVRCGKYVQVYKNDNWHKKPISKDDKDLKLKKIDLEVNSEKINKSTSTSKKLEEIILNKNIIRSKLECQRLAKCNMDKWKTFITLTFEENLENITIANKKLKNFFTSVRRIKKDFAYIAIPEFQKRGAVHYHLLTNIDINDSNLIYNQIDNEKFKHIKYWKQGFDKVDNIDKNVKKIIGYISKYMTKDIDNRLFNHRRYFFSRNLQRPKQEYLNLDEKKESDYFLNLIQKKEIQYNCKYQNIYNQDLIEFTEYL